MGSKTGRGCWNELRQDGAVLLNKVPLQASLREHISSATSPQYLQHCVHAKPSTLDFPISLWLIPLDARLSSE